MTKIVSLSVSGFRNLQGVSGLNLPELTVFLGGNGTGKSALMDFLAFLRDMRSEGLAKAVNERGGVEEILFMGSNETPVITAELVFELDGVKVGYSLELSYRPTNQLSITRESWRRLDTADDISVPDSVIQTLTQFLNGIAVFRLGRGMSVLEKGCCEASDDDTLHSDGRNLAAVLMSMKRNDSRRYGIVVRQIRRYVPLLEDFVFETDEITGKLRLKWRHRTNGRLLQFRQLSDGALRFILLVTLLSLPAGRGASLLCLDEPEISLQPPAVELIADMIRIQGSRRQVWVATQAPLFADMFELENIVLSGQWEGKARFFRLNRKDYQQWLDTGFQVSDIWLSHAVEGRLVFEKFGKNMDGVGKSV